MLFLVLSLAALAQSEATLELHRPLEGAALMPAVLSADGASVLYFKQVEDGQQMRFVYCLANAQGEQQRELYATPVDWDDALTALLGAYPFSADGRVVVATTLSGQGVRGETPDKLRAGVLESDGRLTKIACELDQCTGFDFAQDRLVFIESNLNSGMERHQVKIAEKDNIRVLASGEKAAWSLRISPDAKRAAWLTLDEPRQSRATVRAVDLATGEVVSSPMFRTDDLTFEGLSRFYWDATGSAIYAHVCLTEEGPRPFQLTRYNPFTKEGQPVADDNLAATAVLDEGHLALWKADRRSSAVLRLSDKKLFDLPAGQLVLGGRGMTVIVYNVTSRLAAPATLKLP